MSSPFTLRPYQQATVSAVESAWERGVQRPAAVLPTGDGKTVTFSEIIRRHLEARRGRASVLVHHEELATQAAGKIHALCGRGISVGRVQAFRNEVDADVLVCSIPTIWRESRNRQIKNVTLGIVDEAHHASAPTWMAAMGALGAWAPGTRWAGFSATLDRNDDKALADVWDEVVYQRDIIDSIRSGSLVNPRGVRVQVADLVLDEVKRSRGDLQAHDLGSAMRDANTGDVIARAVAEHCPDRRGVIFAPDVWTANVFAKDMIAAGFTCEVITGETPTYEREAIYERFRTGETMWISNCMVLTEGWDAPWAEVAVIARPTQSHSLYVQMAGRVLRPWPAGGKVDALILDVVGVSTRYPLATIANLSNSVTSVRDGETLADALEREEKDGPDEAGTPIAGTIERTRGELVSSVVDLFAGSTSAWLQTKAGLWFIPTRKGEFFLQSMRGGTFRIGFNSRRDNGSVTWSKEDPAPLDIAMAWAEQYAERMDPGVSSRDSAWRNRPPSSGRLAVLETRRIPFDRRTITHGQAYDLAAIEAASTSLDRAYGKKR